MKYQVKHTPLNAVKGTELTFENVENLYIGNGNCCRCGCGGEYYEASDEFSADTIKDVLKKMASGKYAVESIDDNIFEIVLRKEKSYRGKNKVATLYMKK